MERDTRLALRIAQLGRPWSSMSAQSIDRLCIGTGHTSVAGTPLLRFVQGGSGPAFAGSARTARWANAVELAADHEPSKRLLVVAVAIPAERSSRRSGLGRCRDSSIPQARPRLHHVLALLAEQKNRYYLVVSDRANADVTTHMQLHAVDGPARDPSGFPFAYENGCARPRERRAAGARPSQQPGRCMPGCPSR
jgi:hypothetical protein